MRVRHRLAVVLSGSLVGVVLGMGTGPGVASATPLPQTVEGWIYPATSGPACDVPSELAALSSDPVAVLKAEYLDVGAHGRLVVDTAAKFPCNGYDPANLAAVRAAAQSVYVTVSAGNGGTKSLLANPQHRSAGVSTIESFVSANGLNGVDLDFEPSWWGASLWNDYLAFVSSLAGELTPLGKTVEVDMEPYMSTPGDAERFGAIVSAGAHVVVMAYDHEFDAACAPISPFDWLQRVVAYAQSQVPADDLAIGIPAYGYTTTNCKRVAHVTTNVAYVTMEGMPGFPATASAVAADRDPNSGEIRWTDGGTFYDYVDSTALNEKLQVVENMGVTDVSVWSLGGEPWFSANP